MNYHAVKFLLKADFKSFCVGFYRVDTDKNIARNLFFTTIVKSDDIGIIIVLQKFLVHFQNPFVIAENIVDVSGFLAVLRRNLLYPSADFSLVNFRKFYVF